MTYSVLLRSIRVTKRRPVAGSSDALGGGVGWPLYTTLYGSTNYAGYPVYPLQHQKNMTANNDKPSKLSSNRTHAPSPTPYYGSVQGWQHDTEWYVVSSLSPFGLTLNGSVSTAYRKCPLKRTGLLQKHRVPSQGCFQVNRVVSRSGLTTVPVTGCVELHLIELPYPLQQLLHHFSDSARTTPDLIHDILTVYLRGVVSIRLLYSERTTHFRNSTYRLKFRWIIRRSDVETAGAMEKRNAD